MPTTDRRTKAELAQALAEAEQLLDRARDELDRQVAATNRCIDRQAGDDEALALDQCVRALELLRTRLATAQDSRRGGPVYAELRHTEPHRPTAMDSPIGRILLHLAARYDVDVVAPAPGCPEPEPTLADEGEALLVVPQALANTISQLLAEQPYLVERLGRR